MSSVLDSPGLSRFADRYEAGRILAKRLLAYGDRNPVVVGIAPDGVPVAAEIAHALHAALDTVAIAPVTIGDNTTTARFGTAAEGGIVFFDPDHKEQVDRQPELVDAVLIDTETSLQSRSMSWHDGRSRPSLHGRCVLLVADIFDDQQLASAASCAVRDRGASEVVCVAAHVRLAVALAVGEWIDEFVCLECPDHPLVAAELFVDSEPVSDDQVSWALTGNRIERERDRRLHRR